MQFVRRLAAAAFAAATRSTFESVTARPGVEPAAARPDVATRLLDPEQLKLVSGGASGYAPVNRWQNL